MKRILWTLACVAALVVSCVVEPCDGHSCKHPPLDIEVTR